MEVKQIEAKDTYNIRNSILRPGFPIESCNFEGDTDELTFHLGAYVKNQLVSVASFYMQSTNKIQDQYQYRLRGMATKPEHQNKGYSKALLQTAFPLIKNNHVSILWCNARSGAVGFYTKNGFEQISDEFDIPTVGPHFIMKKEIK